MLQLRRATELDLEFLIKIDLDDEGYAPGTDDDQSMNLAERRAKMAGFVQDSDKAAWVIEDTGGHALAGGTPVPVQGSRLEVELESEWGFL